MTVIDASVWLDIVVGRLAPDVLPGPPVLVPGHFDAEVLAGLRGLCRGGHLAPQAARRRIDGLARAPLLRVPVHELLEEAWALSASVSADDARLARGAGELCDVKLLA